MKPNGTLKELLDQRGDVEAFFLSGEHWSLMPQWFKEKDERSRDMITNGLRVRHIVVITPR